MERRIRSEDLPLQLLRDLYRKFGGTPRFLLQIREAIKDMDAKVLEKELAKVELPAGSTPGKLQEIRDKYFEEIILEDLFSYLNPKSQKALCRSAVYGVPVILEGLAAVAGEPPDSVIAFARSWQDRAFAYQETGKSKEPLWIVYGLLRGWLQDKLSPDEQKDAHKAAGDFLVEIDRQDRKGELGLSWVDCLMEARSQYLQAKEPELARNVTDRLSSFLLLSGFYDGVRKLNAELLDYEIHPSPMIWIANTYVSQGEYDSARIWYQCCIDASAGLNQKEAGIALHGLATIDLRKGDYEAARENFEKAMKIMQQIGDRAGEAATFCQFGILSWERGPTQDGLRMLALSYLINASIGHEKTKISFENLSVAASQLGFSQERLDALLKDVAEAYQKDRGQGLIEAAFPKG